MKKELIYRHLQHACTVEENLTVQRLLDTDPSFKKEYVAVSEIYDLSKGYNYPIQTNTEGQWNKFQRSLSETKVIQKSSKNWLWASAAALVVVVFAVTLIFDNFKDKDGIVFNGNENGVIELSDGSVLMLNKASTLTVDGEFGQKNRTLSLTGSAYFKVSPDAENPFVVDFKGVKLTVVGTSFEIDNAGGDLPLVRVSEGKVNVQTKAEEIMMIGGQEVSLDLTNSEIPAVIEPFNPSLPGWTSDNLQFIDQRLGVIIATVSDHYGVQIEIDPNFKNMLYTVNLSGLDQKTALQTLATVTGLVLKKKDGNYSLKP